MPNKKGGAAFCFQECQGKLLVVIVSSYLSSRKLPSLGYCWYWSGDFAGVRLLPTSSMNTVFLLKIRPF